MDFQQAAVITAVLSPLVGIPLGVITMYLRAIREHQAVSLADVTQRIATLESAIKDLLRAKADFEREYATKEEWVRESMLARQRLERLTELAARIEAEVESGKSVAVELGRAAAAMMELVRHLAPLRAQEMGKAGG